MNDSLDRWRSLKEPPKMIQFFLALFATLLSGFTIKTLWGWYIIPLGVSAITLVHAIGIDTLVSFIFTVSAPTSDQKPYWYKYIHTISNILATLLVGWVFQFFM